MDGIFEGSREMNMWGGKIWAVWWREQSEFLFKTLITIPRHFHSPQGMREKYVPFRGTAVARSTFKIYRKTADISCWFWLNYIKCRKTFWVNLVLWLTTWKSYNGWGLHGIQVHTVALQLATPRSFKDKYTNLLVYELNSFLWSRS